jgi:hypothetical protein
MYIPKNLNTKSKSSDKISDTTPLIIDAVASMCEAEEYRNEAGDVLAVRYTYGQEIAHHTPKQRESISDSIILQEYPTHTPEVAIRYPNHRYTEEGLQPGTASCRNGILLHRIFERATTIDDLYNAIKRMSLDCVIESDEAERLCRNIDHAMEDESVREWFSDVWDDVKTEVEILSNNTTRRPDRVMISGQRAVIVDYKFGDKTNKQHFKQMSEYLSLLHAMGRYKSIEGYVWYINIGHIEPIVLAQ